ncbi:ATP-dependent DNA helicase, RecQ family [Ancylostoma duodenale]|uniref:ATP-dependent DNA helicase n=1 Tax=Ancylostoma duodenale TaxID=51022 RepID=A0A0C2CBD8_9BILA|nr:ATP-dependent DNA helicase, RecQ family [Ancylostoma duodenale]
MSNIDTLVVMSTGAGLVVVISPLISLIEDQLAALRKLGIEGAALNQSTQKEDAKRIDAQVTQKNSPLRLLYITPEKLAKSKRLMNKLEKSAEIGTLKAFAIDEVHCCSQWGHDFRPDYKFLNILKRQFPNVPLLGLTATATANVLSDVKNMLDIPDAVVFKAGFNRTNLHYEVLSKPDTDFGDELARLIKKRFPDQSGIVYCFSRKDCEEVANQLRGNGVRAAFYHADMDSARRTAVHEKWVSGKYNVIVATVAFGMGIDKPDVRYVIHHALPKSVENYFQESGRAGRDGLPAVCILYFRLADMFRQSTMVCTEKTGIRNLYSIVRYASTPGECRRKHLADHFEEKWRSELCPKACDVCANPSEVVEVDISSILRLMLKIIHEQKSSDRGSNRITGAKLVELTCKQRVGSKPGECRRKHLADHFEEKWKSDLCPKACDVCANPSEVVEVDISSILRIMLKIIHEQKSSDRSSNRITGAKLVELTCKQRVGSKALVEAALCHALLNGYLKQDFHFTPYAIHSYIVSGPKGERAKQSQVMMKCKPGDRDATPKPAKKRKLDADDDFIVLE